MHPPELLNTTVNFENHAAPVRNISLPNPHFIALHAGISGILHMSGAAEVLEQIISKYDKEGGAGGLRKSGANIVDQMSSMMSVLHLMDATQPMF